MLERVWHKSFGAFPNQTPYDLVQKMKVVVRNFWGFFTITVALLALGGIPAQIDGWRLMLTFLPDSVSQVVADVGPGVWLVSILISTTAAAFLGSVMALDALKRVPVVAVKLKLIVKGWLQMAEWLSRSEAMNVIENSDFMTVRRDVSSSGDETLNIRNLLGMSASPRQRIVRARLLELILASFEGSQPGSVKEGKYNAELLEKWLLAALDEEIAEDLGQIPNPKNFQ